MPVAEPVQPLARTLMRDAAYDRLLQWIVELRLEPGEKVKDEVLAEQLGVSRMPVREALRRLEDQGFVETAAGSWTRVAAIDPRQGEQLYPIVKSLETLALAGAMGAIDRAAVAQMSAINKEMAAAVASNDFLAASELDRRLHDAFVSRAENDELKQLLRALKLKLRRLENAFFRDARKGSQSIAEHARLITALRQRNLKAAKAALSQNWDGSLRRLLNSS